MATIKDIAKSTGLSIATVSKYLNGGKLKEQNRAIIEKAVEDLDYKVNVFARGLKTNKTMTIGVCLPMLDNLFFTKIIFAIEEILLNNGYSMIICDYHDDERLEKERLKFLASKNVDGIVLVPTTISAEDIHSVINGSTPIVLIDRSIKDLECDTILTDNINASYRAVEELVTKKHRRIGVIIGPETVVTARERLKGYERVLEDYGIERDRELIKVGDYRIESGYLLMNELLDTEEPPSAVFVTNYDMTIGAMIAINERNVSIPGELSFIGYDNMQLAQIIKPPLTIVSQPMEEIGKVASETLLKRLKGDYSDFPIFARLKTEMILNKSISQYTEQ